jgi:hypothetical protein
MVEFCSEVHLYDKEKKMSLAILVSAVRPSVATLISLRAGVLESCVILKFSPRPLISKYCVLFKITAYFSDMDGVNVNTAKSCATFIHED